MKSHSNETDYGFNGIINILNKNDIDHKNWITKRLDKERGGITFMTPNVDGAIYLTWGDIYYVDVMFVNQGKDFKSTVSVSDLENILIKVEKMRKNFVKQTTEVIKEAFKEENLGDVTAASADGREFIIDGKRFFNRRTNPLDAIERTRDGGIKTVSLFDEQGNRHVIWGPQDRVETLAYHIILSEMAKVEGQPTINREQALLEKKAAEEIIRRKATTGKHGSKTTSSLRQEIYELERLFDAALQASDNLRTSYIQEAGATKEDLKNDPELKALNKEMRSLTARIREMKKVLKYRGESVTPTSNEILRAENKAMQVIEDHENQITELQDQIEVSKKKGLDAKARVESLNAASTTEKATDEWIAGKREAVKTMDTERAAIQAAQKRIKSLQAAIAVEQ